MNVKTYNFAGCTIRLESDTPVFDSSMFDAFVCGDSDEPDFRIMVVHSALPEKSGELIFSDDTASLWVHDKTSYYYTSYPTEKGLKLLACRVMTDDGITLFVVPGQRLWDAMVAFAVNYTQLLFYKGIVTLHSSCINIAGRAVLFTGDKGAGKSTQAALWNTCRNAEIVNGDRIAIKQSEVGALACGIPFCGSSKIALNKILPIKAIVTPVKADNNRAVRLSVSEAFRLILGNLTYNPEDVKQLTTALDSARYLAETIPVFHLMCKKEEGAVKALEEQLCQI